MVFGVVKKCLDARLCEGPGSGVEGLFLTPYDGLGVRVHVEVLLELLPWEGVELFNSCDGGVFVTVVGAVLVEGCVYLAGAENYALDLLGVIDGIAVFGVGDDPFKLRVAGEFFDR